MGILHNKHHVAAIQPINSTITATSINPSSLIIVSFTPCSDSSLSTFDSSHSSLACLKDTSLSILLPSLPESREGVLRTCFAIIFRNYKLGVANRKHSQRFVGFWVSVVINTSLSHRKTHKKMRRSSCGQCYP